MLDRSDSAGLALLTYTREELAWRTYDKDATLLLNCNLIVPYLAADRLGLSRAGSCLHSVDSGPLGGCWHQRSMCSRFGGPANTPSKIVWDWALIQWLRRAVLLHTSSIIPVALFPVST